MLWRKRRTGALLTVAPAAGLITGCSSGQGTAGKPDARGPLAPAKPVKLTLPPAYNPDRGWGAVLNWLPPKVRSLPMTTVEAVPQALRDS